MAESMNEGINERICEITKRFNSSPNGYYNSGSDIRFLLCEVERLSDIILKYIDGEQEDDQ
jgi:hypothetical protein